MYMCVCIFAHSRIMCTYMYIYIACACVLLPSLLTTSTGSNLAPTPKHTHRLTHTWQSGVGDGNPTEYTPSNVRATVSLEMFQEAQNYWAVGVLTVLEQFQGHHCMLPD